MVSYEMGMSPMGIFYGQGGRVTYRISTMGGLYDDDDDWTHKKTKIKLKDMSWGKRIQIPLEWTVFSDLWGHNVTIMSRIATL